MIGWLIVSFVALISLAIIGGLPYLMYRDSKIIAKSKSSGHDITWKRRWFQWVLAVPFLIMSIFSILNPVPEGFTSWKDMNQIDIFYSYADLFGHWIPGIICFYITYFCLRKYKMKLPSPKEST